jgi:hypothetical protein
MIKTCNKKDSELAISDEAKANAMTIEDQIESQDIETTDCEGNIKNSHGPVRDLDQVIAVTAPHAFADKVSFIRVENPRTCAIQSFDTSDKLGPTENKVDGEAPVVIGSSFSEADRLGNSRIIVNDSDYKLILYLNVKDGANVLKISYFGKCLKYRENPDTRSKAEYYLCEQAELLGTKDVLLTVHVDRPEIPGTKRVSTCRK